MTAANLGLDNNITHEKLMNKTVLQELEVRKFEDEEPCRRQFRLAWATT